MLATSVSVGPLPRVLIDILHGKKVADGREVTVVGSLTAFNFFVEQDSRVNIELNCLGPLIGW